VQAVENPGAFGDQILAPLGEQPENVGLLIRTNLGEAPVAPGGKRRKGRIQLVVFAPMADGEHPHTRRELRRNIHHFLPGGEESLRERPTQTVGTFYGPSTLGKTLRPPLQRLQASPIRRELRTLQQFALFVQHRDGIGSLVRVDADQYLHPYRPPSTTPLTVYSACVPL
jgi:hypothetical protein